MIRFVGGPLDGIHRDIHRNTEQVLVDQARYVRKVLETGEEVFMFDADYQRRQDDVRQRQAGQALDDRMEQLTRDAPSQPRPYEERRGRR